MTDIGALLVVAAAVWIVVGLLDAWATKRPR
jgi:hypothetical protein